MHSTRWYQERTRNEFAREDYLRNIHWDHMLRANMSSDDRVEHMRRLRRLQQERREMETDRMIEESIAMKEQRQREKEQEEKLVEALERQKLEKLREIKIRQMVRENSPELRALELKLNGAYMNKERTMQMAQKQAVLDQEKSQRAVYARQIEAETKAMLAEEKAAKASRMQKQESYKTVLEGQLQEQETARQKAYDDFLREKQMIDEIVARIHEEDQRDLEQRLAKQQETKRYIEDFKTERSVWRQREAARIEEENERIRRYAEEQRAREEAMQTRKREADAAKNAVYEQLADRVEKTEREKEEMERVRHELYIEEQEHREREKEMARIEHTLRQRLALREAHQYQMQIKKERAQAEAEEEEEFRRKMMQKFADDERLEQMNAQKRRMREAEHRRAVEQLLEERRVRRRAEEESRLREEQDRAAQEQRFRQIVEEERQRLLREHANKLAAFLPKGVLRDEKDLALLDEDARREFLARRRELTEDDFEY
eukprot:Opistho-1_new@81433